MKERKEVEPTAHFRARAMPFAEPNPQRKPAFANTVARTADPLPSSTPLVPPKPRRVEPEEQVVASEPTGTALPPSDTPSHKRCVECGNVFHFKLTFCTSCCRGVVASGTWEPAVAPRPGGASVPTDDDVGTGDETSDDESHGESGSPETLTKDDAETSEASDSDDGVSSSSESSSDERQTPNHHWQHGGNRAMTDALFG